MSTKGKKKKRKWHKTPKRYATVAVIAAVIGILLDCFAVLHFSDEVDYSHALQVTSEEEAAELQGYEGKVLIQGTLKGTPIHFQDAYDNIEMKKSVDVEGDFLYTDLNLRRPEEYVSNQHEVDTKHVSPEYDIRYEDYRYCHQADDLNIYGVSVDLVSNGCGGIKGYDSLYKTLTEVAEFRGIEGSEVPAAVIGQMEDGELVTSEICLNGTIEEMANDASNSLMVFHVLLVVWLAICGFVVFSMYLQRYD